MIFNPFKNRATALLRTCKGAKIQLAKLLQTFYYITVKYHWQVKWYRFSYQSWMAKLQLSIRMRRIEKRTKTRKVQGTKLDTAKVLYIHSRICILQQIQHLDGGFRWEVIVRTHTNNIFRLHQTFWIYICSITKCRCITLRKLGMYLIHKVCVFQCLTKQFQDLDNLEAFFEKKTFQAFRLCLWFLNDLTWL